LPTESDRTPPAGAPQEPGRDGCLQQGDGGALQDGRRLGLLARRIVAYPDDLLLAEVARHAFQREDAAGVLGPADGTGQLSGLLAHDHPFIRVTGLRIYAQLRWVPAPVAQAARAALGRADT
jgi:hypothetical protein